MKRCMYCGQENDDSATTCSNCGNLLLDMPQGNSGNPDEVPDIDFGFDKIEEAGRTVPAGMTPNPGAAQGSASDEAAASGDEASQSASGQNGAEASAPQDEPSGQEDGKIPYVPENEEAQPDSRRSASDQGGSAYRMNDAASFDDAFPGIPYSGQQQGFGGSISYDQPQNFYEDEGTSDEPEEGQTYSSLQRRSRKRVKSALFFLAALFYTAMVGCSVFYIITGGMTTNISTAANTISNFVGTSQAVALMNQVITLIGKIDPLVLIGIETVFVVPQFFIMLGLWIAFAATSPHKRHVSTGGYTLVKAMEIIRFILACIILLAVIAVTVSYVVAAVQTSTMTTLIIGIIILLTAILISVLTIMFFVQLLFSIKLVKVNVRDGEYIGRMPGYVLFMGFVLCLLAVGGMILMAPDDYVGLGMQGAKAIWYLLISIWGIWYRATVRVKEA